MIEYAVLYSVVLISCRHRCLNNNCAAVTRHIEDIYRLRKRWLSNWRFSVHRDLDS